MPVLPEHFGVTDFAYPVVSGGSCDYPLESTVTDGTIYAFGAMEGTFVCPVTPPVVVPAQTVRVIQGPKVNTANQGVSVWSLINGLKNYLMLVSELGERNVRLWLQPTRPQLSGADTFIWYRPTLDEVDKAIGPSRWGNRTNFKVDVHLVTRTFIDEAQVDERRAEAFYTIYFKLESAFQGKNLFTQYNIPTVVNGVWFPPEPPPKGAGMLTVEPMFLSPIPVPDRTQKEEGSLETAFTVNLPAVLALTVP